MRITRIVSAALLTALCLTQGATTPVAAGSDVHYVDDDGRAGRRGCDGSIRVPTRIQPAIDASGPGDIVRICPGTYRGKVVIGEDGNGISLVAATDTRPTLRAQRSGATAVVVVRGARNVLVEHLRFLPHGGPGRCTEVHGFIRARGDTAVRIVDNVFDGVGAHGTSCTRYRNGIVAMTVATQRVEVVGNTFHDFGNGAVYMYEEGDKGLPGVRLRVVDNRLLVRQRRSDDPDGDGVAIDARFRGRAVIQDNVLWVSPASRRDIGFAWLFFMIEGIVIRRNVADGVTTGISVVPTEEGSTHIVGNVLRGRVIPGRSFDSPGVGVYGHGAYVARNRVSGFDDQGILVYGDDSAVEDNDFRGNGGTDCFLADDFSVGTWRRNLGHESDPPGLCSPS